MIDPQVTINLGDYNDLLQSKIDFQKSDIGAYQEVITEMIKVASMSRVDIINPVIKKFEEKGIKILISKNQLQDGFNISVSKV